MKLDEVVLDRGPHPAALDEKRLLKQCEMSFGRAAGPGGQHRNKVETAVSIRHLPTGLEAVASERRKQYDNRRAAIRRMRMRLASRVRVRVDRDRYRPSELWESRRQGTKLPVAHRHPDYPGLLAEALDVIVARDFDVAGAAGVLAYCAGSIPGALFFGKPGRFILTDFIDGVLYGLLTGVVFAWLWPAAEVVAG